MPILPLGVVCVASALGRAGHDVKITEIVPDNDIIEQTAGSVKSFLPDCIGIAVRNIDNQTMGDTQFLLEPLKTVVDVTRGLTRVPIVLGGAGYSMFPASMLKFLDADVGISGEGEQAFPAVVDCMVRGGDITHIPGVYTPTHKPRIRNYCAPDLDAIPMADPALWACPPRERREAVVPFQTRRGCAMNCSYCSTATIEGTKHRRRRPQTVVENLARHAAAGFRRFYCTDNTFTIPASYADEFCMTIVEAGLDISWMSIVYPGNVRESLVGNMARAGCCEVSLGFESGSAAILRAMNKKYSLSDVREASGLFARHGIRQMGFLLLGGPGETQKTVNKSLAFADSLPLDMLKITIGIRIYPHTALAATAVAQKIISPEDDLLLPKFYCAPGLKDWLYDTVKNWTAQRPHWQL